MQTFRPLVFIGLIFCSMIPNVFGEIIWEDVCSEKSISFAQYDKVVVSATLPESQKQIFLKVLKKK